jgi:hypothetical protein
VVEHDLAKVGVAGSNPVSRSSFHTCAVAGRRTQVVEGADCKSQMIGSGTHALCRSLTRVNYATSAPNRSRSARGGVFEHVDAMNMGGVRRRPDRNRRVARLASFSSKTARRRQHRRKRHANRDSEMRQSDCRDVSFTRTGARRSGRVVPHDVRDTSRRTLPPGRRIRQPAAR